MGSQYLQTAIPYNTSSAYYTGSAPAYDEYGNPIMPAQSEQEPLLYSSAMAGNPEVQHPVEQKKPGLFDKIGAAFKGVLDAPGKILSSLKNPKNLLMIGGGIALSVLFPPAAPFVAAAGVAMAGMGVLQGGAEMAQAWQNDDLDGIREGSGTMSANGLGLALGMKGMKDSTISSMKAAGKTRIEVKGLNGKVRNIRVDDMKYTDALRLQPRAMKMSLQKFKTDFAKTKGSLPQRVVQVARGNVKGVPGKLRPQRKMTKAQRTAATVRLTMEGLKLIDNIRQAKVTPAGSTTEVSLVQALRDSWTSGGGRMGGLQGVFKTLTKDAGVYRVADPLLQQSLQVAAKGLEGQGYGGRFSTGLRIASEGVGARGQILGLKEAGQNLHQGFGSLYSKGWTSTPTAVPPGSSFIDGMRTRFSNLTKEAGARTSGIQWRSAGKGSLGAFTEGSSLFGKATLVKNVVTGRPGMSEGMARSQEFNAFIKDATDLHNRVRPNHIPKDGVIGTDGKLYANPTDLAAAGTSVKQTLASNIKDKNLTPGTRLGDDGNLYALGKDMPTGVNEVRVSRGFNFPNPSGLKGMFQSGSLANEAISLADRGRGIFAGLTGKTETLGKATSAPLGGNGKLGRFGGQFSQSFEFVKAHPGAVAGSAALPIASGVQEDLRNKYMEMAQMQQMALGGMEAQA
jgi:hypothetical protein